MAKVEPSKFSICVEDSALCSCDMPTDSGPTRPSFLFTHKARWRSHKDEAMSLALLGFVAVLIRFGDDDDPTTSWQGEKERREVFNFRHMDKSSLDIKRQHHQQISPSTPLSTQTTQLAVS